MSAKAATIHKQDMVHGHWVEKNFGFLPLNRTSGEFGNPIQGVRKECQCNTAGAVTKNPELDKIRSARVVTGARRNSGCAGTVLLYTPSNNHVHAIGKDSEVASSRWT